MKQQIEAQAETIARLNKQVLALKRQIAAMQRKLDYMHERYELPKSPRSR